MEEASIELLLPLSEQSPVAQTPPPSVAKPPIRFCLGRPWARPPPELKGKILEILHLPKKHGRTRLVYVPTDAFKKRLKSHLKGTLANVESSPSAHGFVLGRNVYTCAKPHVGKAVTIRFDVEEFFDSLRPDLVRFPPDAVQARRELLYTEEFQSSRDVETFIHANLDPQEVSEHLRTKFREHFVELEEDAHVERFEADPNRWTIHSGDKRYAVTRPQALVVIEDSETGALLNAINFSIVQSRDEVRRELFADMFIQGAPRQGLPTSPAISNMAFGKADKDIQSWLMYNFKGEAVYTRYADDLFVSLSRDALGDDPQKIVQRVLEWIPKVVRDATHERIERRVQVVRKHPLTGEMVTQFDPEGRPKIEVRRELGAIPGLGINKAKTRIMYDQAGRVLCSLRVDMDDVHPLREHRRKLRAYLHNLLRMLGVDKETEREIQYRVREKGPSWVRELLLVLNGHSVPEESSGAGRLLLHRIWSARYDFNMSDQVDAKARREYELWLRKLQGMYGWTSMREPKPAVTAEEDPEQWLRDQYEYVEEIARDFGYTVTKPLRVRKLIPATSVESVDDETCVVEGRGVRVVGDFQVTNDPAYFIGQSNFTIGWRSCVWVQGSGEYKNESITSLSHPGLSMAVWLAAPDKVQRLGKFERRSLVARSLLYKIEDTGDVVYGRVYPQVDWLAIQQPGFARSIKDRMVCWMQSKGFKHPRTAARKLVAGSVPETFHSLYPDNARTEVRGGRKYLRIMDDGGTVEGSGGGD